MTGTTAFSLRSRKQALLWRVVSLGSLCVFLAWLPAISLPHTSLCGFLWLTGRPCPFCGMTRALGCLLRGELGSALGLHPLSPLALTGLLLLFLGGTGRQVVEPSGWRSLPNGSLRWFWAGSLFLLLAYGAWRLLGMGNDA